MYTGVCWTSANQAEQTNSEGKNQRSIVYARILILPRTNMNSREQSVRQWLITATARAIPMSGAYIPQAYTAEWWQWRKFEIDTLVPDILDTMDRYQRELGVPINSMLQLDRLVPGEVAKYRAIINSGIPPG